MGPLIWLFQFLYFFQYQAAAASFSSLSPPSFSSSTHPLCRHDQRSALLQFKHMFTINNFSSIFCDVDGIPSYPKTLYWNEDNATDCCNWDGVTCDRSTGHVIELDLSCSQLYGTIHPNSSLFQLSQLRRLNLASNDFNGSHISYSFGRFASLTHLKLSHSSFSGSIPSEIFHLSKLISLNLSSYPESLLDDPWTLRLEPGPLRMLLRNLTRLQELDLAHVNISSVLLDSLSNITSLTSLDLSSCELQGSIPKSIGNLTQITKLVLYGNNFKGEIPSTFSNLKQLTYLGLSNNNLDGKIPDFFAELTMLEYLHLGRNNFKGGFPSWVANLTKLHRLYIFYNQLTGPIASDLCGLKKLQVLSLAYNSLSGTIPSCLFNLPSLRHVYLADNRITGQIPKFQHDSPLIGIGLSNNKLHGPIPPSISSLLNLTFLSLRSNDLCGVVDLRNLKNLEFLYLSNTNLSVLTSSNSYITLPNLKFFRMSSCKIEEFPDFLRTSENLEVLDLSDNIIHGEIPDWVGFMWKTSLLHLNISHNFLTHVKQLLWENLQIFDLHSNLIEGPLPVPPISAQYFFISNNSFTGGIPLSICNASYIEILDLSHNKLSGEIPQCLGNSSSFLSVLDLRSNQFQGSIPLLFTEHNELRSLNLNGNQLEGPLPRSLISCRNLEVLDVGNNKINDTFPHWLGTLLELQVLVLHSNKFHGPIDTPTGKSPFLKLRIVDLSYNEFTGHLPMRYFKYLNAMKNNTMAAKQYMGDNRSYYHDSITVTIKGVGIELERILTVFTTIDISSNNFSGGIPNVIGRLDSLKLLNLSHNGLSGHIPDSLGDLKNLESLDLSSNKLLGEIPNQLAKLTFLAVLNLSWNNLHGPIPIGPQFNTFGTGSYVGNSGLCGFPLPKECENNHAQVKPLPVLQPKEDDLEFDGFTWKVVMIGYGCGLPLGLFLGFLMFLLGRPKFIVRHFQRKRHEKMISLRRAGRRN